MGLKQRSNGIYLQASYGCLRRKCKKDHPDAVERDYEGKKSYAIEHISLTGILKKVAVKEDQRFGRSWNVFVEDEGQTYIISLKEKSRFCTDFLKRLPNLNQGDRYAFTPYDFEKNGKKRVGFSIKVEGSGEPIGSYYQNFAGSEETGWEITNLNGFPDYTGTKGDKDEFEAYLIILRKFLRERAVAFLGEMFTQQSTSKNEDSQGTRNGYSETPPDEMGDALPDDIPFQEEEQGRPATQQQSHQQKDGQYDEGPSQTLRDPPVAQDDQDDQEDDLPF